MFLKRSLVASVFFFVILTKAVPPVLISHRIDIGRTLEPLQIIDPVKQSIKALKEQALDKDKAFQDYIKTHDYALVPFFQIYGWPKISDETDEPKAFLDLDTSHLTEELKLCPEVMELALLKTIEEKLLQSLVVKFPLFKPDTVMAHIGIILYERSTEEYSLKCYYLVRGPQPGHLGLLTNCLETQVNYFRGMSAGLFGRELCQNFDRNGFIENLRKAFYLVFNDPKKMRRRVLPESPFVQTPDSRNENELSEEEFFVKLKAIFNARLPLALTLVAADVPVFGKRIDQATGFKKVYYLVVETRADLYAQRFCIELKRSPRLSRFENNWFFITSPPEKLLFDGGPINNSACICTSQSYPFGSLLTTLLLEIKSALNAINPDAIVQVCPDVLFIKQDQSAAQERPRPRRLAPTILQQEQTCRLVDPEKRPKLRPEGLSPEAREQVLANIERMKQRDLERARRAAEKRAASPVRCKLESSDGAGQTQEAKSPVQDLKIDIQDSFPLVPPKVEEELTKASVNFSWTDLADEAFWRFFENITKQNPKKICGIGSSIGFLNPLVITSFRYNSFIAEFSKLVNPIENSPTLTDKGFVKFREVLNCGQFEQTNLHSLRLFEILFSMETDDGRKSVYLAINPAAQIQLFFSKNNRFDQWILVYANVAPCMRGVVSKLIQKYSVPFQG